MGRRTFLFCIFTFILATLIYADSSTCPEANFGIDQLKGNDNAISLSGYPVPFHMIARSNIYNVAIAKNGSYDIETTRTRVDMYFRITQKYAKNGSQPVVQVGSIFNILSVNSVQE